MRKNWSAIHVIVVSALALTVTEIALARGGRGGGDGLNPYSELSGNDRSGGVNSGNYRQPRYNTYLRAYGPYGPYPRPMDERYRPDPHRYYGYPY
ncbi:hypothetical protein MOX02_52820 [Methylobacterium oxalidis]|uniref:Uncharacterized protein n=1 Tax=Methylobacterium oxalidis TaxID=944322 RepID=A0A512JB70_9HYPH|nr:hypothetical protein [Methylobacterium oxalidis]GEP07244.1 hypothetical protein MOX02_52820 [Methylobacterium oxalidis]GJE33982.1 hypothetical protein LDDCCGHA_4186 [Methylobacterium oxalidis]GLS63444.1 hypothetical protein GCM10007888_18250 [Methylobacterium oxalidis]